MNLMNDLYLTPDAVKDGWDVVWDPDLLTLHCRGKSIAAWSSSANIGYATLRSQIWAEIAKHEATMDREAV